MLTRTVSNQSSRRSAISLTVCSINSSFTFVRSFLNHFICAGWNSHNDFLSRVVVASSSLMCRMTISLRDTMKAAMVVVGKVEGDPPS